jgi:hypothetical protein
VPEETILIISDCAKEGRGEASWSPYFGEPCAPIFVLPEYPEILFMQTHAILEGFYPTHEVCEMSIKVFYVSKTIASLVIQSQSGLMSLCTCICIYTCVYVCIYMYICIYTKIYIYTCIQKYTYIHVYIHIYAYAYT